MTKSYQFLPHFFFLKEWKIWEEEGKLKGMLLFAFKFTDNLYSESVSRIICSELINICEYLGQPAWQQSQQQISTCLKPLGGTLSAGGTLSLSKFFTNQNRKSIHRFGYSANYFEKESYWKHFLREVNDKLWETFPVLSYVLRVCFAYKLNYMPGKVFPTTSWNNDMIIRRRKSQMTNKHTRNTHMQRLCKQGRRGTPRFHNAHSSKMAEWLLETFLMAREVDSHRSEQNGWAKSIWLVMPKYPPPHPSGAEVTLGEKPQSSVGMK